MLRARSCVVLLHGYRITAELCNRVTYRYTHTRPRATLILIMCKVPARAPWPCALDPSSALVVEVVPPAPWAGGCRARGPPPQLPAPTSDLRGSWGLHARWTLRACSLPSCTYLPYSSRCLHCTITVRLRMICRQLLAAVARSVCSCWLARPLLIVVVCCCLFLFVSCVVCGVPQPRCARMHARTRNIVLLRPKVTAGRKIP